MRKNNILMTAVLMGAMTLAACTGNEELTGGDDSVQHLALNFSTRAAGDDTQENFATGDKVKVFADEESTVFTLGSDGKWLNSDNKDYIAVAFPASITAAYPGTDDASTAAFSMPNVTDGIADQSTEAQFRAADYMTSDRWTLNAVPDGLDLVFRHHLCKVTIIISGYGDEFNGVLPTIASEKIISKGSGIAYTNAVWTATGSKTDITPLKTADATNGLHTYEAIITPGTYATGDNLMTLSVNGSTLTVPFAGTIESGNAYNFTLKVDKTMVTANITSVTPWGEGTPSGGENLDLADIGNKELTLADLNKNYNQAQRNTLTAITLNGNSLTFGDVTAYIYDTFKSTFPNVTTVNFTGSTIGVSTESNTNPAFEIFTHDTQVKTINSETLTSLGANAFAGKSYSFGQCSVIENFNLPNVVSVGDYCFNYCGLYLKTLSLPKVTKVGTKSFANNPALHNVCFASLKDFNGANAIFGGNITDLAFGTTDEMTFPAGTEVMNVFWDSNYTLNTSVTLYLNENGYEYKNKADLTTNTWRGITFKAIKKYSEYTYKKD